ncbi:MAG: YadA-like family protein, partial [Alphaproteobacteria bacterium]|nr:YadA-like family protein [Alphaproteobacteria bacterium]
EKKIEEVNDEMNKGLASTAALASLVPLSGRYRTQLSLGMGGYRDKQAIAAGGYHYLAGNVLLNAGLAWGGDDSISYKAGVTYGF